MGLDHEHITPGSKFEILTKTYVSKVRYLAHDLVQVERIHSYANSQTLIDTFPSVWHLGLCEPLPGQLTVRSGAEKIELTGPIAVLLTPFSIVEWGIQPGILRWHCFSGTYPLPQKIGRQPRCFRWNGVLPRSALEVNKMINADAEFTALKMERQSSPLGEKIKRFIDERFHQDMKIQELSTAFNLDRSVLTREFTRTYGLSPVAYRSGLRVFEAIRLMALGHDVTHATFQSGFSSPGQFIQHFKKHLGTTPVEYCAQRQAILAHRLLE